MEIVYACTHIQYAHMYTQHTYYMYLWVQTYNIFSKEFFSFIVSIIKKETIFQNKKSKTKITFIINFYEGTD